ncbi:unnamed protein product [Discosporangium mesarthrocarpum]
MRDASKTVPGSPGHSVRGFTGEGGGGGAGVGGWRGAGACATLLSAASAQAKNLADHEDDQAGALMLDLLEARVRRLETRMKCLDELEGVRHFPASCIHLSALLAWLVPLPIP